jgi:hypothetical protein
MKIKGWLTMMGWAVLFSTSLVFARNGEHSSEIAEHPDRNKEGKKSGYILHKVLHKALMGKGSENSVDLSPDLSPLYSVLIDNETRDFVKDRSKDHRNFLRLLWRYSFDISDLEYSDEEESEEEPSKNEEDSVPEDWRDDKYSTEQCGAKLFPITRQLKERFTPEKLLQMNIDLEKLLEIENLLTLPRSRKWTPEEESLLDEAIRALDRSGERR